MTPDQYQEIIDYILELSEAKTPKEGLKEIYRVCIHLLMILIQPVPFNKKAEVLTNIIASLKEDSLEAMKIIEDKIEYK